MPRDGNAEIRMISARSRDPTLEGGYRFIPLPKDVGKRRPPFLTRAYLYISNGDSAILKELYTRSGILIVAKPAAAVAQPIRQLRDLRRSFFASRPNRQSQLSVSLSILQLRARTVAVRSRNFGWALDLHLGEVKVEVHLMIAGAMSARPIFLAVLLRLLVLHCCHGPSEAESILAASIAKAIGLNRQSSSKAPPPSLAMLALAAAHGILDKGNAGRPREVDAVAGGSGQEK